MSDGNAVFHILSKMFSQMIGGGINTLDKGPANTMLFGLGSVRFQSSDQSAAPAAVTNAPPASEYLVVTDITVSVDTAMTVNFSEETSGDVLLTLYMPETGSLQFTPRGKIKLKTAGKRLMVQTSASGNIAVTANYHFEV